MTWKFKGIVSAKGLIAFLKSLFRQDAPLPKIDIDWKSLPEGVNYTAVDADGRMYAYDERPTLNECCGEWSGHAVAILGVIDISSMDYRLLLFVRPKKQFIVWGCDKKGRTLSVEVFAYTTDEAIKLAEKLYPNAIFTETTPFGW